MMDAMFALRGSSVALPTPFSDGAVDRTALTHLVQRQIDGGTQSLVACGSTGEAATFDVEEYAVVIRTVVRAAAARVPVIAGCGALSTRAAAALGTIAASNGAAALLCAPPPYCKPTQAGIIAHLRVLGAVGLPILLYDVPGRSAIAVADETVASAHDLGLIIGIKDATGDLSRPPRLRALCGGAFVQMSGDDATAPGYRAMGGHGCISVTANLFPALCALLHRSWDNGDMGSFASTRDLLAPFGDALFRESNPIPVKAALEQLGFMSDEVRLPLTRASSATRTLLATLLAAVTDSEDALTARMRHAVAG